MPRNTLMKNFGQSAPRPPMPKAAPNTCPADLKPPVLTKSLVGPRIPTGVAAGGVDRSRWPGQGPKRSDKG